MKKYLQLLVLATIIAVCAGGLLLPFGVCKAGDRLLNLIDDEEESVDLNTPFEFFGVFKSNLVIGANGYILFDSDTLIPASFSSLDPITNYQAAIVPFHDDLETTGFGSFFRETTLASDLMKAEGYVLELFPQLVNFEAANLIVITYDRFQFLFNPSTTYTFQVLIVQQANGKSVVLFLYKEIVGVPNRDRVTIGVNAGDNVNFRTLCVSRTIDHAIVDETTQSDVCNTVGLYGFTTEIGEPTTCIVSLDPSPCPNPPPIDPQGGSGSGSGSGAGRADPCAGNPAGAVLPRPNPNSVMNENLCSGFIRCVQVGDQILPQYQCCPPDTCFIQDSTLDTPCLEECCAEECSGVDDCDCESDPQVENDSTLDVPCLEECCAEECSSVDDCDCESEPQVENECAFQAVEGEPTMFMGKEVMYTYKCSPGTCWDDDLCTCVRANNTGYNDCIPWVSMDFDDGRIKAVSGLGHQMWLEYTGVDAVPNGALATPYFARFDGDGDFINLIALANAYVGNSFVVRLYFRLETNDGVPSTDEEQIILTNCFDPRGTTQEDATIDVCVLRQAGTGVGTMLKTKITYNNRMFMIGNSMDTAMIDLTTNLQVDTWYEYLLIYCGDDEVVFTAVLDEGGTVLDANTAIVDNSQFVVVTQSGFVLGTSAEASKEDFDGGIDEVLMYRCKPEGDIDFDADFAAIKTFIG